MARILITGGAGFIGSHIAEYHLQKGDCVWVLDSLISVQKENIQAFFCHPCFQFTQADICCDPILQEAVQWADRIYHMAALLGMKRVLKEPVQTLSVNIQACEKVLQAVAQTSHAPHVLIASSSSVYVHTPISGSEGLEEKALLSIPSGAFLQEAYGLSKITNEMMALSYAHQFSFPCTIARIFNVIGIHQSGRYGMVVPTFVRQALQKKPMTVYGDGMQTRSFCNVHDVVLALDLLLGNPLSNGEIVNIGNPEEVSILHLAQMIQEKNQGEAPIVHLSYREAYGIDFEDVKQRRPCIEKLIHLTGFKPRWTLSQTLDEIMDYMRSSSQYL